ncbi:aminoglycoside phosphotransferase family protein [Saccharothrix violaceirubra]|uniref:Ser/Thr protein kinase RdoA (MazF antagonist) n=1 Tax=Saccharothrix violaceirubra TaxID=413306 RepID=A0A7W7SZ29_9PSEU|nr:aminoglycoside phosphotransferase family protein [Saccharothrix violaceirubra]MBB4963490.1 Ser/Thr protein kinase RdoA (MazF antagonist) [Saccharothrix violaceirubra]
MSPTSDDLGRALVDACARLGLDPAEAEPVRLGENAVYRLPGGIVVRISRPGQHHAAEKEIRIARWLADHDVPAVRALDSVAQPILSGDRAATFWEELPPHRHGTPAEVAGAIRRLHDLPVPDDLPLGDLDPFVRLRDRIDSALTLPAQDRHWLRAHLRTLEDRYLDLPPGLPARVVHGDAWVGNVVATADRRVVLLDLERCAVGPPEWDLVSTAIKHTSFGWVTAADYHDFCRRYGHDVTTWAGFSLLRDIRELRMTCYLAQRATEHPAARDEARSRVDCLRHRVGSRPWAWTPAP